MKVQNNGRQVSQEKNKPSAEDEWAHLADAHGNETKIQAADAADVENRNIFLGKGNDNSTPWEVVTQKTQNLADMTSNISQYVKLVNAYLKEQKSQVTKIQDLKNRFDDEIENLQKDNTQLAKLNNTPIQEFDAKELQECVVQLTKVRDSRISKINELKKELAKTEEELKNQDKQIDGINEQIKVKQEEDVEKVDNNVVSKDELIKELSSILKKYDGKIVSNVLSEIKLS
jgi:DNA repair exonuclease SbcCD ATPase subunit